MRKVCGCLLCLFLLCGAQKYPHLSSRAIEAMKHELLSAQKKLAQQQAYIAQLEEEIAWQEIASIQWEIDQVNQTRKSQLSLSHQEWLALFQQQREVLGKIIRSYPACRLKAQEVLDEILLLTTELSDAR